MTHLKGGCHAKNGGYRGTGVVGGEKLSDWQSQIIDRYQQVGNPTSTTSQLKTRDSKD
jgi:hypothetical protein